MLIDYLRYQAFRGRLRSFFDGPPSNYADPEDVTGEHIRFAPDWLASLRSDLIIPLGVGEPDITGVLHACGIRRASGDIAGPTFKLGSRPPTADYEDVRTPRLEIIIDIAPERWQPRYAEPRGFEETRILFRRCGPAHGQAMAGDRVVIARGSKSYGTLCGFFDAGGNEMAALTCGHVTLDGRRAFVRRPRDFLGFTFSFSDAARRGLFGFVFGFSDSTLGPVLAHVVGDTGVSIGPVSTQLDAALISCPRPVVTSSSAKKADLQPISAMLQEQKLLFRSGTRLRPMPARIAAVTVRKQIDLCNDGNLRWVGDVLMLGHREAQYVVSPLTRGGDSGSAVIGDGMQHYMRSEAERWYGMVIGGDEMAGYASYAECIWSWASDILSSRPMDFAMEA